MKEKAIIFDGEREVDEGGQYRPRMREVAEEEETEREGDICVLWTRWRENDEVEKENGNRSRRRRLLDKEKSRGKCKHEGESNDFRRRRGS